MDWEGQKLSEQIMQYLLVGFALVAFIVGYCMSSYRVMLLIYLFGVVITFIITVPEWSFFNRHPLQWAEPPRQTDVPTSRQLKLKKQQQQQAVKKSAKPAAKR